MIRVLTALVLLMAVLTSSGAQAAPEGQMTWAVHVSIAPTWLDPAEAPGLLTPYLLFYALHDALVKPMPGQLAAPSLAESSTASRDGLAYEFTLRKGVRFHNARARDGGGRQVFLRAVPGRGVRAREGARAERGGRGPARTLPPQAAVARLHDVLHELHGSGLDRAEEVRGEGGRRRLQEGPGGRRSVPIRILHPGRGDGPRGLRRLLAQGPRRETPGVSRHPRRVLTRGGLEARRSRRRILRARTAGRGGPAHEGAQPQGHVHPVARLDLLPRSMGPQVALGTIAGCAWPSATPSIGRR